MSLATLYDVHGNLPALEAVLAEVPDDAVIAVGGDVASGPFPQQTVDRLRGLGGRVEAYDEPHGAYWWLDLEPRRTPYELDVGDWPFEWPARPRDEALAFFTSRGL